MFEDRCVYDSSAFQVLLDVWPLDSFIQILEVELPRVIEEERKRIWQDVKAGDEQREHNAEIAEYQLDEGLTTRLLTGTALIATWATYESVVKRSAKQIQQSKKLRLRLRDIKGSFPESARTYFEDVLQFDLHPPGTDWNRLSVLYGLRNALAHANGQLEDVPEHDRKKVEEWVTSLQGLKIADGYLIISIEFVRSAFNFLNELLSHLGTRMDQISD